MVERVKTKDSIRYVFSESCAIYDKITKNTADPDRPLMIEHTMAHRIFDLPGK
jgi:hypothetical protein